MMDFSIWGLLFLSHVCGGGGDKKIRLMSD